MNSPRTKNRTGSSDTSMPLFAPEIASAAHPGSLNDDALVRGIINDCIKHSKHSREQIAEQMAELLQVPVTARMLACFTAESKELHRWPGAWDRAFCAVVGDDRLLRCRAELAGYKVIDSEEQKLLELGREYLRQKRAAAKISSLENDLAGVEL